MNEEFLVNANHQFALITSLPFVHTARRTYRLKSPVKNRDCSVVLYWTLPWEPFWTLFFRGRWSRNKVSVGEPAEGSLSHQISDLNSREQAVHHYNVSIMAQCGGNCDYFTKKQEAKASGGALRCLAAQYLTKQLTESKTRMCPAWCFCVARHSLLIY